MKTCKNCGTVNEVTAVKCTNCRIEGKFTLHKVGEPTVKKEKEKIQCTNCGSHEPGHGLQCVHCHFPLAPTIAKSIADHDAELKRKVS